MVIDNEFEFGETVYLITDSDHFPRLVTGFSLRKHSIMYELSCGTSCSTHMNYEITKEKNYANV